MECLTTGFETISYPHNMFLIISLVIIKVCNFQLLKQEKDATQGQLLNEVQRVWIWSFFWFLS